MIILAKQNIEVKTHDGTSGSLTDVERQGQGAYVPLNDDDDYGNGVSDSADKTGGRGKRPTSNRIKNYVPSVLGIPIYGVYHLGFFQASKSGEVRTGMWRLQAGMLTSSRARTHHSGLKEQQRE